GGRAQSGRILEHPDRGLERERLRRLAMDPRFAHPLDDRLRAVWIELELGRQQHHLVQAGTDTQLLALLHKGLALALDGLALHAALAKIAKAVAGEVAQRPADRAGQADETLQAG